MTGTFNTCDHCGKTEQTQTTVYASPGLIRSQWITVSRGQSVAGDLIPAGVYHLCSPTCFFHLSIRFQAGSIKNEGYKPAVELKILDKKE